MVLANVNKWLFSSWTNVIPSVKPNNHFVLGVIIVIFGVDLHNILKCVHVSLLDQVILFFDEMIDLVSLGNQDLNSLGMKQE